MAEKAPEEARNHLCGLQISRVACEAEQDAEGARLRRGSRRLSSLCYDCASCEYVEVICLSSCKSLKDCTCTGVNKSRLALCRVAHASIDARAARCRRIECDIADLGDKGGQKLGSTMSLLSKSVTTPL